MKEEVEPLVFRRPAKILSGDSHTYAVKYDSFPIKKAMFTNKVSRKALRPRLPLGEVKSRAYADIVEVFDDGTWKLAEMRKILDLNKVVVRLLGSVSEIVAPISKLRVPQNWRDNRWIPLQKESVRCKKVTVNNRLKRRNLNWQMQMSSSEYKECKLITRCTENQNNYLDQWSQKSLGGLKKNSRRSPVYQHVADFVKRKQVKKIERCDSLLEKNSTNQLFDKVDDANSPQSFYGEKEMNCSFYHKTTGIGQIGQNTIASAEPKVLMSVYHSGNENVVSSVGSCSTSNNLCRPFHSKISSRQEPCGYIDDAESFCLSSSEPSHSREDKMTETIHCLELDAYHSTLKSLYASGSLNWDQESLLTNLRFALNISSDEHLSALKDLMSASS